MGRTGRFREELRQSEQSQGYTIDDLSALTGVPSRTIRFYQAKGALPAPERRGRLAFYDQRHVERLKLVAQLQDRGLNLRAIRDLFERASGGDVSVSEWLGVGEKLRAPWVEDRPRLCTEAELNEVLGEHARPGLVADLVRVGLVRREDATQPGVLFVPSPAMLQIALALFAAGVDIGVAQTGHDILRRRIARAANELADFFINRPEFGEQPPEQIARSVEALRSAGISAVQLIFAQEMERALREMFEAGKVMPPKRRRN